MKAELSEEMNEAAENLDFERAAIYATVSRRSRMSRAIRASIRRRVEEADVFAIHHEGGLSCMQVFFFRTGQNWGNRAYFPTADPRCQPPRSSTPSSPSSTTTSRAPRQILLSDEVEEPDLLARSAQRPGRPQVAVAFPKRGEKRDLVEHVLPMPARRTAASLPRRASQTQASGRRCRDLQSRRAAAPHRGLRQLPYHGHQCRRRDDRGRAGRLRRRTSTASSTSTPKSITPGDDFGMMREVMTAPFPAADQGERQA